MLTVLIGYIFFFNPLWPELLFFEEKIFFRAIATYMGLVKNKMRFFGNFQFCIFQNRFVTLRTQWAIRLSFRTRIPKECLFLLFVYK